MSDPKRSELQPISPLSASKIPEHIVDYHKQMYQAIRDSAPPYNVMGTRKTSGVYDYDDLSITYRTERKREIRSLEFEYEDAIVKDKEYAIPVKDFIRSLFDGTTIVTDTVINPIDGSSDVRIRHDERGNATSTMTKDSLAINTAKIIQAYVQEMYEPYGRRGNNVPTIVRAVSHMIGYLSVKLTYICNGSVADRVTDILMNAMSFPRDNRLIHTIYKTLRHTECAMLDYMRWWRKKYYDTSTDHIRQFKPLLYTGIDDRIDTYFETELHDFVVDLKKELDYSISLNQLDPIVQYLIRNTIDFKLSSLQTLTLGFKAEPPYLSPIDDNAYYMYRKRIEVSAVIFSRTNEIFYTKQSLPNGMLVDSYKEEEYMSQQLADDELYIDEHYVRHIDIMPKKSFKTMYNEIKSGTFNYKGESHVMEMDININKDEKANNSSLLDLMNCYNAADILPLIDNEDIKYGFESAFDDQIINHLATAPHKAIDTAQSRTYRYGLDIKQLAEIMSEPTIRLLNSSMINREKAYWFIPATRRIYAEMKSCKSVSRYIFLEGLNEFIQDKFGIDTTWISGNGDLLLLEKLSAHRLRSIRKTINFNIDKLTLKVAMKMTNKRLRHLLNIAELKLSYVNQIITKAELVEANTIPTVIGKRAVVWERK